MVGSGVAGIVLAVALLSHGSVAVTINKEKEVVMRSEAKQVEVSPYGEVVQTANGQPKEAVKIDDNTNLSPDELDKLKQFCNKDFPIGKTDKNECTNPATEQMIISPSSCIFAGQLSGASTSHDDFHLAQGRGPAGQLGEEYKRPRGCFKAPCGASSSTHQVCYFYNGVGGPIDDKVAGFTGTPVCSRARLGEGKKDAQGGCATGYQVVNDEETCRTSATCLGKAPGSEFRTGTHNASKKLDFLQGCFIHPDGEVYFNEESTAMGLGAAGHVKGQNICNVSSTTRW